MDITPQDSTQQQSISDDQELAQALAGVLPDVPEPEPTPAPVTQPEVPALQFEETALPTPSAPAVAPVAAAIAPTAAPTPVAAPATDANLDDIKKTALGELRPLIDKVELPAEEKFDTYLMLIRSTDDSSLIAPAHAVAQGITDEKRRAEALLDIIKEIDYLSRGTQPTV